MLMLPAITSGAPLLDVVHNLDALVLLKGLPAKSIQMILTSPPYDDLRIYGGNWSFPFEAIARESYRVLADGGVLVWVVGDMVKNGGETLNSMRQALYFVETAGFRMHDTMIYQKDMTFPDKLRYTATWEYMFVLSKGQPKTVNLLKAKARWAGSKITGKERDRDGSLRDRSGAGKIRSDEATLTNVWYIQNGYMKTTKDIEAYQHPAMFPEELARRHIMTWTNPGDVVLDYFAGSGTTLKMARNLNRRYIGGDISREYVELARRRLAQPYTLSMFDRIDPAPKPVQHELFAAAQP